MSMQEKVDHCILQVGMTRKEQARNGAMDLYQEMKAFHSESLKQLAFPGEPVSTTTMLASSSPS